MNGFCLLPDVLTRDDVLRFNEQHFHDGFQMNTDRLLPHVTVLQTHFKEEFDGVSVLGQLRSSRFLQQEPVAWVGQDVEVQRNGLVFWYLNPVPAWLVGLNEEVVDCVERWVVFQPKPEESYLWDADQEESYRRTGVVYNLKAFRPHFTVGVSSAGSKIGVAGLGMVRGVRFRSLAYTENGEQGQILRVLGSVPLRMSWD